MKPTLLHYIRAATDADAFFAALSELLFAAFPGQLLSVYLLGSRADGTAIATSDADLLLVFRGCIEPARRVEMKKTLAALQQISPIMLDVELVGEDELRRGVTPNLKQNRLLAGPDFVKDCSLKSTAESVLYYAGLGVHFIQVIRKKSNVIRYPLEFPDPNGEFCGYEINGMRVAEGEYVPGLHILVCLVLAIASFRLAATAGIFTTAKGRVVANYREYLPHDPWLPLVEGVYDLGRIRLKGQLPRNAAERTQLAQWCRQVLKFENDFLGTLIMDLDHSLPLIDPNFMQQAIDFVHRVDCYSHAHAVKLEELKARLTR